VSLSFALWLLTRSPMARQRMRWLVPLARLPEPLCVAWRARWLLAGMRRHWLRESGEPRMRMRSGCGFSYWPPYSSRYATTARADQ
jgi:hypothetical protein